MPTTAKLIVVHGKPAGKVLPLPRGKHMIGRGPECQLRPNSEWISRQHCLLTVEENDVRVRDLGSTNGTLVNGLRVTGSVPLRDGDAIAFGAVETIFRRAPGQSTLTLGPRLPPR